MEKDAREEMKYTAAPLEAALGYTFRNKEYLVRALTHSSYINEHRLTRLDCNERLEFLGDAVLELISSDFLYHTFAKMPEGTLTKKRASLVSEKPLAKKARKLSLGSWLLLAKGAEDTGGRTQASILSDALESVIGAIYLDGGFECAKSFVLTHVLDGAEADSAGMSDSKTCLQELSQHLFALEPEYALISSTGPDHDRLFVSRVSIGGTVYGEGSGHSKKLSEQAAAAKAIEKLGSCHEADPKGRHGVNSDVFKEDRSPGL